MFLDSAIESVASLKSVEEFRTALDKTTREAGFSSYAYVRSLPAKTTAECQPYILHTVRPDWGQHYLEHGFFNHDPMVSACRYRNLPLVWSVEEWQGNLAAEQRHVLEIAGDYGIQRGIMIPVHSMGGDVSMLTAYFSGSDKAFREVAAETQHGLHLFALHVHDAIVNNLLPATQEDVGLTQREVECLKWSAQGKTAWETSQILHISERTVNFHLANGMRKLGVHSKTHAVARLSQLGYS